MTKRQNWMLYGALAAGAFIVYRAQAQKAAATGAAAAAASSSPTAPNAAVSPTAAATTQNMSALAGLGKVTPRFNVGARGAGATIMRPASRFIGHGATGGLTKQIQRVYPITRYPGSQVRAGVRRF